MLGQSQIVMVSYKTEPSDQALQLYTVHTNSLLVCLRSFFRLSLHKLVGRSGDTREEAAEGVRGGRASELAPCVSTGPWAYDTD